ncbi:PilZ domain-containing protein [Altererythrobacter sp. H2]|uniref:PilZ domain-containing protein n=1 Tax=Altererythrobacter sp. H2 TaxID=3108391 RepID=UPI002B4C0BEC|nr:PilZ domain-containing protein [Altererythrobacter sp. H2]WRK95071.1 PilZ domain-containing protein [Altererythrobacter sp. H2]
MSAVLGRRRSERLTVCLPGKVVLLDGEFDCALDDVSQTGARIITDAPLPVGRRGILSCSPLEAVFSVVWTRGRFAGLEFEEDEPLGTIRLLRWHNDRDRERHDATLRQLVQRWGSGGW